MSINLKEKKVFITGGSRGLGKAMVEAFLKEGAIVHFLSTKESPSLKDMEKLASENGTVVKNHLGNVGDEKSLIPVLEEVFKDGIDIVINNAGIIRDGLIFRMPTEDWNEVLNVNLTGAFLVAREAASKMIRQRSGSIINISSVVGLMGNAGQTNYAASKAGLIGFSKSLAKETASRGVRVNVIAPGYIDSDMTATQSEKVIEEFLKLIPLKRSGQAKEVADAALFLASDMASYITGQVIQVDGGMIM